MTHHTCSHLLPQQPHPLLTSLNKCGISKGSASRSSRAHGVAAAHRGVGQGGPWQQRPPPTLRCGEDEGGVYQAVNNGGCATQCPKHGRKCKALIAGKGSVVAQAGGGIPVGPQGSSAQRCSANGPQ